MQRVISKLSHSPTGRLFGILFLVLVAFPGLCAVLVYGQMWMSGSGGTGVFAAALFLPLTLYYLPVAVLIGEPYFVFGIGAGPTGFVGLIIGALFYTAIALLSARLFAKTRIN